MVPACSIERFAGFALRAARGSLSRSACEPLREMPMSPPEPQTSRPFHSGGPSITTPAKSRPGVRGQTAPGMRPIIALASLGLMPAARISTTTSPSDGPLLPKSTSAGANSSGFAGPVTLRTRITSTARCAALRAQAQHRARLARGGDGAAEIVEDAPCLGDELGIALRVDALGKVDVVLEADTHIPAQEPGLREHGIFRAADAEGAPQRPRRQDLLRVEERFRRARESILHAHHDREEPGSLQRAVGEQVAGEVDVAAIEDF